MKKDVQDMESTCGICQRCKDEIVAQPGLLQPLAIPTQPCSDISLDFIEGLTLSRSKNVILVVIDRFTNMVIPSPSPSSNSQQQQQYTQ